MDGPAEGPPLPSEVFLENVTSSVNQEDVHYMVSAQKHMLSRFEKTNEMLLNFNSLSKARYETTVEDFHRHTQLLNSMKKDLDSVFKRIRVLKTKLSTAYPDAFSACSDVYNVLEEGAEEEEEPTTPKAFPPVEEEEEEEEEPETPHVEESPKLR